MTSKVFIPTYLYIKQHTITGKLYFGKTTYNPETYLGSGTRWKAHIKKHGKAHVTNLWYCLFLDQESCTEFALTFSRQQNIVESPQWLNLIEENGLDGSPTGIVKTLSEEHKEKIRRSKLGRYTGWHHTEETKAKIRKGKEGKKLSEVQKQSISIALKGQPRAIVKCPHCGKEGGVGIMSRWHFDNCKLIELSLKPVEMSEALSYL